MREARLKTIPNNSRKTECDTDNMYQLMTDHKGGVSCHSVKRLKAHFQKEICEFVLFALSDAPFEDNKLRSDNCSCITKAMMYPSHNPAPPYRKGSSSLGAHRRLGQDATTVM